MKTVVLQDMLRQRSTFVFAAPALLLLVIFFIVPVAALLLRSVTEPELGLQNYRELFATSTFTRVFLNTFLVAGITTVVTLLIGYPVAWLLAVLPQRSAMLIIATLRSLSGARASNVL